VTVRPRAHRCPRGGAGRANSKRDLVTGPIRGFCALHPRLRWIARAEQLGPGVHPAPHALEPSPDGMWAPPSDASDLGLAEPLARQLQDLGVFVGLGSCTGHVTSLPDVYFLLPGGSGRYSSTPSWRDSLRT
jgi:hypothetical protein